MPLVLCAPDKMRNALSAHDAARAMALGAHRAGWTAQTCPVADGGEGTLDVLAEALGSQVHRTPAEDALGRRSWARFALAPDRSAVVVAADVVGLEDIPEGDRDPLRTSSRGLAAPILAAVAEGSVAVTVYVGGTANVDGGMGLLLGLGATVTDASGLPLAGTGADLARATAVDLTVARRVLAGVRLTLATDVDSPLSGPTGAAHVFGPQKGASPRVVEELDRGLRVWSGLVGSDPGRNGSGAAGGLGYALMALGADQTSGVTSVLEQIGFRQQLAGADLCVTAEGSVDASTGAGKAVTGVLAACRAAGVACVVLGGAVSDEADGLYDAGAAAVLAIGRRPRMLAEALDASADDLAATTRAACALAAAGRPLGRRPGGQLPGLPRERV